MHKPSALHNAAARTPPPAPTTPEQGAPLDPGRLPPVRRPAAGASHPRHGPPTPTPKLPMLFSARSAPPHRLRPCREPPSGAPATSKRQVPLDTSATPPPQATTVAPASLQRPTTLFCFPEGRAITTVRLVPAAPRLFQPHPRGSVPLPQGWPDLSLILLISHLCLSPSLISSCFVIRLVDCLLLNIYKFVGFDSI